MKELMNERINERNQIMKRYIQPDTNFILIEGNMSICTPTSKVGFGSETVSDKSEEEVF